MPAQSAGVFGWLTATLSKAFAFVGINLSKAGDYSAYIHEDEAVPDRVKGAPTRWQDLTEAEKILAKTNRIMTNYTEINASETELINRESMETELTDSEFIEMIEEYVERYDMARFIHDEIIKHGLGDMDFDGTVKEYYDLPFQPGERELWRDIIDRRYEEEMGTYTRADYEKDLDELRKDNEAEYGDERDDEVHIPYWETDEYEQSQLEAAIEATEYYGILKHEAALSVEKQKEGDIQEEGKLGQEADTQRSESVSDAGSLIADMARVLEDQFNAIAVRDATSVEKPQLQHIGEQRRIGPARR